MSFRNYLKPTKDFGGNHSNHLLLNPETESGESARAIASERCKQRSSGPYLRLLQEKEAAVNGPSLNVWSWKDRECSVLSDWLPSLVLTTQHLACWSCSFDLRAVVSRCWCPWTFRSTTFRVLSLGSEALSADCLSLPGWSLCQSQPQRVMLTWPWCKSAGRLQVRNYYFDEITALLLPAQSPPWLHQFGVLSLGKDR